MRKPRVFLNIDTYIPGYKGGGPVQSVKNMIEMLKSEFDFYIFTSNHDFGSKETYKTVRTDEWNDLNGIRIFYSSDKNKIRNLSRALKHEKYSLIFLNSFFSKETILTLIIKKINQISVPFILMPRGELLDGALEIKKTKKNTYIHFSKFFRMLNDLNYFVTSLEEKEQVRKILATNNVFEVENIPNRNKKLTVNTKVDNSLKIVFLSRITEKKNLDYALKTLKKCISNVELDIYGTLENLEYWEKCKNIIKTLPKNIKVEYKGELPNEDVVQTLSEYDLFYFPTKSENYGHVISEALQASIPVLISDQTPWLELEKSQFGWSFNLANPHKFTDTIEQLAKLNILQINQIKEYIYDNFSNNDKRDRAKQNYINLMNELLIESKLNCNNDD